MLSCFPASISSTPALGSSFHVACAEPQAGQPAGRLFAFESWKRGCLEVDSLSRYRLSPACPVQCCCTTPNWFFSLRASEQASERAACVQRWTMCGMYGLLCLCTVPSPRATPCCCRASTSLCVRSFLGFSVLFYSWPQTLQGLRFRTAVKASGGC